MPNWFRKVRRPALSPSSEEALEPMPSQAMRLWFGLLTGCVWIAMLATPVGVGVWAVIDLLELPALPQCFAAFSDPSSVTRLYCAKRLADRQTSDGLQQAIRMVNLIPDDDPLKGEGDRLSSRWSTQLLEVGEAAFQEGNLDEAIDLAHQLPDRQQANQQIETWKSTWNRAEDLYQQAEQAIEQQQWYSVLTAARALLAIDNRYWATTQHQALMSQMQAAKDNQQQQQQRQARTTTQVKPVEDLLTRLEREQQQEAYAHLTKARGLASSGDLIGLKAAVDEASQLLYGDPYYEEAQHDLAAWRKQIEVTEDRPLLNQAIELATQGDQESLQAAIMTAGQIGWGRFLYEDAQAQIEQWRAQVYQLQAQERSIERNQLDIDRSSPIRSTSPVNRPNVDQPAAELTSDPSLTQPTP